MNAYGSTAIVQVVLKQRTILAEMLTFTIQEVKISL